MNSLTKARKILKNSSYTDKQKALLLSLLGTELENHNTVTHIRAPDIVIVELPAMISILILAYDVVTNDLRVSLYAHYNSEDFSRRQLPPGGDHLIFNGGMQSKEGIVGLWERRIPSANELMERWNAIALVM